ncbi:hypothetical protein [Agromyces mangrovi Wang et al. 2018]|uniref:hypothetical protein n=1 Tax=Agromyces mangrovi TaxID=1858653 RepID=UPI0025734228|nr:hypothetical protein [Agromyces mangrovi]BDZ64109.1 hypothetical protein GCM10025877_10470 [Agromyces mangrovi]
MKTLAKSLAVLAGAAALTLGAAVPAQAYVPDTAVPGHQKREGGKVVGHYTLEQYGCEYVVNYRGDFGGDPYLNDGWIFNKVTCDDGVYTYLIVHESDPRYTGDPELAVWGTWEYVTITESGVGNTANPHRVSLDDA